MAGTVTRTQHFKFEDTTLVATYTFAYPDEFDGVDWDGESSPDESLFDLTGNLEVNIEGPGTIHADYYRLQGNSRNPWFSADFNAANTPATQTVGRGPTPRTVADLAGVELWRVS